MMSTLIQDLTLFAPEVFLFCSTIVLLMAGLYGGRQATQCMYLLGCLVAMVTIALLVMPGHEGEQTGFEGLLISNTLTDFAKILVLIGTTLVMILSHFWMRDLEEQPFEFAILVLLASLGMMLMVSANNLLSVYMSFELMSLSLYILAAIRRDSLLATEAGVKYFVLGSLASGILLFGMSLIYGFVGSTSFVE
jgi:NADH-quinone oxidoreductase subunit N